MTTLDGWQKALGCAHFALEKKAYDLVVLAVGRLTSIADYFLICTGRSDTQVQSICRAIEENLMRRGVRPYSIEGYARGHWILMDYSDVIVHIFYQPVREFYNLERLWSHAARMELPEPYGTQARMLTSHQFSGLSDQTKELELSKP